MIIYYFLTLITWVYTKGKLKMRALQRNKYILWVRTRPKNIDKTVVQVSPSILVFLNYPTEFLKGFWV